MTETTNRTARGAAVERLLALPAEPDRDTLRPYLTDPDPDVRRAAVEVVATWRPDWGVDALCLALLDAAEPVRIAAAEALSPLQDRFPDQPQLFDFLEQALDSPSLQAREIAVRLLRRTSDASIATFAAAARDSDPEVRTEAVRALADFRAVTQICALADDFSRAVRVEVAKTLGQLGDVRAAATLRRLAMDEQPEVQAAAVAAVSAGPANGRLRTEFGA